MAKKLKIFLFFLIFSLPVRAENNFIIYGESSKETKVKIKIFSSLTCPYCAEFHTKFLPTIVQKYIPTKKVTIELLDYPLDLPALKAAQVQKCLTPEKQKTYLDKIYLTQANWS